MHHLKYIQKKGTSVLIGYLSQDGENPDHRNEGSHCLRGKAYHLGGSIHTTGQGTACRATFQAFDIWLSERLVNTMISEE